MINGLYILRVFVTHSYAQKHHFREWCKDDQSCSVRRFSIIMVWSMWCFYDQTITTLFLHWTDVGWQHLEMLHVIMMVRHALTRKLMNSKLKIANQKGRWSVIFPSYSSESFTFHEHIRRQPLPWLASGLDSWTTTSRG